MKKVISSVLVGVLVFAGIAIAGDITSRGMGQGDLYTFLSNVVTLVNELKTDHATFKTNVDATETLVEELHDDHATTRTVVSDLKTLLNGLRTWTRAFPLGNPGFAIATNFDVQNGNALSYTINGVMYSQAASQTFDTGTSANMTADTWAIALLSLNAAGDETVTWATNSSNGYASEAVAIANLPANPTDHCPLGYITVLTASGQTWTAGTDALQGGAGGNPSDDTNYYNLIDAQGVISAAVSTSPPATLTATKPDSGPATVSASDLSLTGL